jgi:hypothetical protein
MVAVQGTVASFATDLAGRVLSWRRRGFGIGGLGSRKKRRGWWLISWRKITMSGRKGRILKLVVGRGVTVLGKNLGLLKLELLLYEGLAW